MSTFPANQIVGKSLIAKRTVSAFDLPTYDKNARKIGDIKPGQSAGVVFSFVGGQSGRPLHWEFIGNNKKTYYIEHAPGLFDVKSLQQQGVLTTQQQQEKQEAANETLTDKIFKGVSSTTKYVLIGGGVLTALYIFLNRKR
jgi:hypothetical protein